MSDHKRLIETKEKRLFRIQVNFNSAIYYFMISALNFYFIKTYEIEYLPKYLGGEFLISEFFAYRHRTVAFPVRLIFLIATGHHLERLYSHLRYKQNSGDFWTMILHHFIAITMMVNCFAHRHFHAGLAILLLSDISDFFLCLMRIVREIKPWKKYTILFYLMFLLSWLITRTFIFNVEISWPLWSKEFWNLSVDKDLDVFFGCLGIGILSILNTFWLYTILFAGYKKIVQNQDTSKFQGEVVDNKEDTKNR